MKVVAILADDHLPVRQSIKLLLERDASAVVWEASDGLEAVRLAGELQPELAILDIGMPGMNGIEAAGLIAVNSPFTRIIMLSVHTESHYVFEALRAGARGYVLKSTAGKELMPAIHQVSAGSIYLSPSLS